MRHLLFTLLLLVGCTRYNPKFGPSDSKYNAHGKKLVIVAPAAWQDSLIEYVNAKHGEGFFVTYLNAEDETKTLGADLVKAKPDYVFLVGDESLIPTVFKCSDVSSWSTMFAKSCTYSDYWLGDGAFVVGRLMTHDVRQVEDYVLKAAIYRSRAATKRAYIIGDRYYETDDTTSLDLVRRLGNASIRTKLDVVNMSVDPFITDGAGEADAETVASALDQGVDLIGYFGHGSADGWGYLLNINQKDVAPAVASATPLVFAMACETARNAPNPPWYPYVDVNGYLQVIMPGPPLVPATLIPDPAPIQPWTVLNDSMGARLTSDVPGGAMVFIGETVVTGAEGKLLTAFYDAVGAAYTTPTTIGDIWASVQHKGVPEIWQIVGDPSTWFHQLGGRSWESK